LATLLLVLVVVGRAHATTFRVGPNGDYAAVADAISAAQKYAGTHVILLQAGTFYENLALAMTDQSITISGGWDPTFKNRGPKDSSTIDGGFSSWVLMADVDGGSLTLERLRFIHGLDGRDANRDVRGAGLHVLLQRTRFLMTDCSVEDNRSETTAVGSSAMGGGLYLRVLDHADATVQRTGFRRNVAQAVEARGGGAYIEVAGISSTLRVTGCTFANNRATGAYVPGNGTSAWGGGLVVHGRQSANLAQVIANRFATNLVWEQGVGAAMALWSDGSSTITARRNSVRDASMPETQGRSEVDLWANGQGTLQFSDSEIVNTPTSAIGALASYSGRVFLTNLTLADNRYGVSLNYWVAGTLSLANSILFNTHNDLYAPATTALLNNLVGVDPWFVAPPARYDLSLGSPGIDRGAGSVPGGLGPLDIRGVPRVTGSSVDVGAYELQ
jgi:hypothetical protein